jgi:uncharacterized protein with NRDE domain
MAGGTWLATNEHGVIAGLTNKPMPAGRDQGKRSRGELPLIATRTATAAAGVALLRDLSPADFNPCWLLVGDRDSLFYVDMTTGASPAIESLPPGIHVLENRPLHTSSPKAEQVRAALAEQASWRGPTLVEALAAVLASHTIPEAARKGDREDSWRPLQTEAACVHAGPYGTRSATVAVVAETGLPGLHCSDGPPCTHALEDASHWWGVSEGAISPVPQ